MLQIVIGNTNTKTPEALEITPQAGFKTVIAKLKDLRDFLNCACIVQKSLGELIWLFEHLEIVAFTGCGNIIYSPDYTELYQAILEDCVPSFRLENIHQAWNFLLYGIAEDIEELHNYGEDEKSPEVIFLKNILHFLTFTDIAGSPTTIDYYRT